MKYIIDVSKPWTKDDICKILQQFQTRDMGQLGKRKNYYAGKQKILLKKATDVGKPCNKIVCNFVKNIVDTYEGYAMGIPVTYSNNDTDITTLLEILKYNDVADEDAELYRNGLIYGTAAEICYLDEEGKPRFKWLDPRSIIPVYANNLEEKLMLAIRFYKYDYNGDSLNQEYFVEVYDNNYVYNYKTNPGFQSLEFIGQEAHHFKDVPISFFSLNNEETAVAENIFSLQDAYNTLYSDSLDNWEAFVDAYMVLKGVIADDEELAGMKEHRVLMMDTDASAEYLVKNTNTEEISTLLKLTEQKIRELSSCPNFASEEFDTSSGIAIKFRCMELENNTAAILNNFRKTLQRRIELLSGIDEIISGTESTWRDINITFTRNLPNDALDVAEELVKLKGLVPDKILLEQVPFVKDADKAWAELEKQKEENLTVYNFNTEEEDE